MSFASIIRSFIVLDESLFSFLTLKSQVTPPSIKQLNSILNRSYGNLLLDENDLPDPTNSLNEQHRSILLIDNCDLHP